MGSTRKRVLVTAIAAVALAVFITGCGRDTVAKVNGRKIPKQEYYSWLEVLPFTDRVTGQQMESGAWVLERLITEQLVLELAEKEKVPPTDEQVNERLTNIQKQPGFADSMKASGITKERLRNLVRVDQAYFNLQTKDVKVTRDEVKKFYEDNKVTDFTKPEHAYVAAIFVESEADADQVMKMLKEGVEFSTVARKLCSVPALAAQGGRLPQPIVRGDDSRVSKAVQDVVLATPKGKYTKPIPRGGSEYVVFKVLRHVAKKTEELRDVEFAIKQRLMVEKGVEKKNIDVREQLADFRKDAKIEIYAEQFKDLKLQSGDEQPTPATGEAGPQDQP